jgi:probable rRNA maturation factor
VKPYVGLGVFVDNRTPRKGVPTNASFTAWVKAALHGRHNGRRQVNVVLFGEREARAINRKYRGRDYATNVLSFGYEPLPGEKTGLLGDLAICPAVVAREAAKQRKKPRDHYAHLTIHGTLHLLGFDHETGPDATRMEALETRILAALGIGDPYAPEEKRHEEN